MPYEKNNKGSLFTNDQRKTDKHPNASGKCMVGGVEYWIAAWTNESKTGTKYLSLAFTPMSDVVINQVDKRPAGEVIDDELPF